MRPMIRAAVTAIVLAGLLAPAGAQTLRADIEEVVKDYIADHPEAIERIIEDYLAKHPEAVKQAIAALIKQRATAGVAPTAAPTAAPPDRKAEIGSNAAALFRSPHQAVIGNPNGDVTLVEFFDYNCGYCKRALSDTAELLKSDPQLRIVLKEFPILGAGSLEAAKVSIAVRMQNPAADKYYEFHRNLLAGVAPANKTTALAVAKELGLDVERLEKDIESDEVRQTLEENVTLAHNLGINGTPGYVVGDSIVPGAVGEAALKQRILAVRSRQPG